MSNLLPPGLRKTLWWDSLHRMLLAVSLLFLGASAITTLALLPSLLVFRVASSGSAAQPGTSGAPPADISVISTAQQLLVQLSPVAGTSTAPIEAITAALSARPQGVAIDHITYSGGPSSSLILSGTAARKESVNEYKTALVADKRFSAVSVPVAALLGADSGRFTVTLGGIF